MAVRPDLGARALFERTRRLVCPSRCARLWRLRKRAAFATGHRAAGSMQATVLLSSAGEGARVPIGDGRRTSERRAPSVSRARTTSEEIERQPSGVALRDSQSHALERRADAGLRRGAWKRRGAGRDAPSEWTSPRMSHSTGVAGGTIVTRPAWTACSSQCDRPQNHDVA